VSTTYACLELGDIDQFRPRRVDVTVDTDGDAGRARLGEPRLAEPPRWLLLPGLSDAHVHVAALDERCGRDFLSCGVCHVRDVGGPLGNTRAWAEANALPEVTHYGWPLDSDPPPPHACLLGAVAAFSPEGVVNHVRRLRRFGASGIKLYYGFPAAWVGLAVRAAHDHGLSVAYHIGSGSHPRFRVISVHDALAAGVDSIEHIHSLTGDVIADDVIDGLAADDLAAPGSVFFRTFRAWAAVDLDGPHPRALIERFVASRAIFVPTLSPFAAMIGEVPAIATGVVSLFRDHAGAADVAVARRGFGHMLEFVRRFVAAGGRLAVGTDTTSSTGVSPQHGVRSEIGLLLRAGIAPDQILAAATARGHRAMGIAPAAATECRVLVACGDLTTALTRLEVQHVFAGERVIYTATPEESRASRAGAAIAAGGAS
jgi:hypothetical protein